VKPQFANSLTKAWRQMTRTAHAAIWQRVRRGRTRVSRWICSQSTKRSWCRSSSVSEPRRRSSARLNPP
jgi:hypothetical protein